ncbi:hypothetical protein ACIF83_13650, partial [Streptomyces sp. NPDC085866]|uniref:hypothetical protein n=1 Tax=Streptomyces sp. NPDC085866 TaxID=3365736 RepID=UPI0037CD93B8
MTKAGTLLAGAPEDHGRAAAGTHLPHPTPGPHPTRTSHTSSSTATHLSLGSGASRTASPSMTKAGTLLAG